MYFVVEANYYKKRPTACFPVYEPSSNVNSGDTNKFHELQQNFPIWRNELLFQLFRAFHKEKLHTKLCILYSRKEFRTSSGAIQLFHFIISNNLKSSLLEVVRLQQLVRQKNI